jgi:hypothetical protein
MNIYTTFQLAPFNLNHTNGRLPAFMSAIEVFNFEKALLVLREAISECPDFFIDCLDSNEMIARNHNDIEHL